MNQQFNNVQILAGQGLHNSTGGKVLTVKACSLPINVAIDGGAYRQVQAGSVINIASGFQVLNFQNFQAVNVTFSFEVGDEQAPFSPQDNSASNAATFAWGNLGIANGAAAAGGLPACSGTGFLQITNNMQLSIPSVDPTGHRRQVLYLNVDPAAAESAVLQDLNNNTFLTLTKGQIVQLTTDAAYKISGAGGTVGVNISSLHLSNN